MLQVLLAEDDAVCRRLIETTLKKWGYDTIVCDDGNTALEILTGDRQVDVAILDWNMPRIEGPEVCKRHARSEHNTFCYKIILSGFVQREQIFEAIHGGAHDVLQKPVDLTILKSRLEVARTFVREKRTMEEMSTIVSRYAAQMEALAHERAQQLVHADRMSSLGTMASGIAHELNNPMSFISGNAQNLKRFWQDIEPVLRDPSSHSLITPQKAHFILEEMPLVLEGIMKGVHRVTKIVNSLRKYSGKSSDNIMKPFAINDCITQAVELCRGAIDSTTTVILCLDEPLPNLKGDALQIEQVLVNILVNASHAIEHSSTKEIRITTKVIDNEHIAVVVEDSGVGIPETILEKIWDPFVTTKEIGKGTGLGLSISSGIVKAHGGTVSAGNRKEGGARFEVRLPVGGEK